MTISCCECGQFCVPVDAGCYYGDYYDFEPPDESYFCPKCSERRLQKAIQTPEEVIVGAWWQKPNYVSVAKSILRHRKKIMGEAEQVE